MQKFSLHTHTLGFDGRNTEEEMVLKAQSLGFEKIGFSNHFIVHENIKDSKMYRYAHSGGYHQIYSSSFEEAIEKFKPHYEKIDELKEQTGFPIYKGMEVDFFAYNGWQEGFEKALNILKPDYLIGSAHFIAYRGTLYNSHDIKNAGTEEQNMLLNKYYQNIRLAAQSGMFNFLAHLDLMKKVGLGQEQRWMDIERQTIEVLAQFGAKTELNTSGFKLAAQEPYPSSRIMKLLADYQIPVIISDDAHNAGRLGDHFKEAESMAKKLGIVHFYDPFKRPHSPVLNKKNSQDR